MKFIFNKKIKSLAFFINLFSTILYILRIPRVIKNPNRISNILIINNDYLGDTVISSPVFSNLKYNYPEARITVLCRKTYKPLMDSNPNIDNVILYPDSLKNPEYSFSKRISDTISFLIKLRKYNYDFIIELFTDYFTIVLSIMYIFTAYRMEKKRYALKDTLCIYSLLIGNRSPRLYKYAHDQYKIMKALKSIGVEIKTSEMSVYVKEEWKSRLNSKLDKLGTKIDRYFIICPGASWAGKMWDYTKFARAADLIAEEFGYQAVISGLENEKLLCQNVSNEMKYESINLAGQIKLNEFTALVSGAQLLLGNDSGPSHLAAGLNIPVVAIMGTSDIEAFRPLGEKVKILYREVLCGPCYSGNCYMPRNICLQPVTPEEVVNAARELLNNQECDPDK